MVIALSPVTSSQIAAVGYDAATRELVIRFRSSGRKQERVYSYDGVPFELAKGLIAAESPGSYFHRHIRQGRYPYRRHEGEGLRQNEPLGKEARR
jgi:KTSC domain